METLSDLRSPARAAGRIFAGVVSLATAPVRGAISLLDALLEQVSERVTAPAPPPGAASCTPAPVFGADADGGPAPVTPSVARVPSAKRRRTKMRDPRPPVVLPGLLDPSGESRGQELSEDTPAGAAAPAPAGAEALPGDAVSPASEPAHVESGETLIAELADPGAEDGAGAELRVEEPWHRYDALSAADIIDRLATQDAAALSVLLLYERAHRARKTVLDAAARALARRS